MTIATNVKEHVLEVTVTGNFNKHDADMAHDVIADLVKKHDKINILCDLTECDKLTKSGLFEDARVNTIFAGNIGKMAIVDKEGHHAFLKKMVDDLGGLSPVPTKMYTDGDDAHTWLSS